MANYLPAQRSDQGPPPQVGKNRVSNLVKRHDTLHTRFTRRYNHSCAKCEDPKIIREWFNILYEKMSKYGFAREDIWNFNKTGFAMGLCSTTKVATNCDYYGRAKLLQPGNREWVTAIEAISAIGESLPPYIILKVKEFQDAWFKDLLSS